MNDKARLGRWVLLGVIVFIALIELALAAVSIQAGKFRGEQVGRVMLTGWLLSRVWDGAKWARWLTSGLFLVTAFGMAFAACSPDIVNGRLMVVALLATFAAMCAAISVGLALPCMGAYQAARREAPDTINHSGF